MPEAQQQDRITADQIRKLLSEKYPPTTDREQVYVSVVLALLESTEELEERLRQLGGVIGKVAAEAGIDLRALLAGKPARAAQAPAAAGGASAPEASVSNDPTPFPAGVPTSAPPGTAQRVTVQPNADADEIPAPNVTSGPAVNARPNLNKPTPNGAPKAS